MKKEIITAITQEFISVLEAGQIPWKKPWLNLASDHNGLSGHFYRGLNIFTLAIRRDRNGYDRPQWL